MKRLFVILLIALLCLAAVTGCAKKEAADAAGEALSEFESLVREGDEALEAGEAKAAFDLYTEALEAADADDADGSVAAKQAHAKSLFIARNLLSKDANPLDPEDSVTILAQYSDAETETVEAKRRVIEFMQNEADSMRRDIPELRSAIEAEKEFKVPLSIYMAGEMTENWNKTLSRIPGDFGAQSIAALGLLGRAADEANMITEHEWVEECVADLERCEATLAELDAALAAMRSQL